ncbi:hypothetical protein [Methylorubrum extorquens]|nr:hypothetical protein [Methylorubrum extorquens]
MALPRLGQPLINPAPGREHPLPHLGHSAVVPRAYFAGDLADEG